jgi:hypothetical protein
MKLPAIQFSKDMIHVYRDKHIYGDVQFLNKDNVAICEPINEIIDSDCVIYKIKSFKKVGRINLWMSIKYFGRMVRLEPEFSEKPAQLSLNEVKSILISIIQKSPKKFRDIDIPNGLISNIKHCNTFRDICKLFDMGVK